MNAPTPSPLGAERRQRVLDATRELMAEHGFRVSMDAVAQRAGCSKQTLYAQFGSKQALMQALMHEHLELTTSQLESFDGRLREPLLRFGLEHIERISEPGAVASLRLLSAEAPQYPDEARSLWQEGAERLVSRVSDWLRQAMDAGLLRHDQPHAAAELLLGMLVGLDADRQRFSLSQRDPAARRAWVEFAIDTFLKAFAPTSRMAAC